MEILHRINETAALLGKQEFKSCAYKADPGARLIVAALVHLNGFEVSEATPDQVEKAVSGLASLAENPGTVEAMEATIGNPVATFDSDDGDDGFEEGDNGED